MRPQHDRTARVLRSAAITLAVISCILFASAISMGLRLDDEDVVGRTLWGVQRTVGATMQPSGTTLWLRSRGEQA